MEKITTAAHRVAFLFLILFFGLQLKTLRNHALSFYFGDETEHVAVAWEMKELDKTLYTDLITNHQPLPFVIARIFLQLIPFTNLFQFIDRIRLFMFFLSIMGTSMFIVRFGPAAILASMFIESIKFFLLGYHLLSESLVVYPIMIICAFTIEKLFNHRYSLKIYDGILFGMCIFFVGFSLLPAWPFLAGAMMLFLYKNRKSIVFHTIVSISLLMMLLFLSVPATGWFFQTVYANWVYFLPYENTPSFPDGTLRLLLYPLLSFVADRSIIAVYYRVMILMVVVSNVCIALSSRKKSFIVKIVLAYTLLIMVNLRVIRYDVSFYSGFHLLPQMSFLAVLVSFLLLFAKRTARKIPKTILFAASITLVGTLFWNISPVWWGEKKDKMNDFYVNYGEAESIGMVLKVIARPKDTLLAGPMEGYINMASNIPFACNQNSYLAWSWRVPQLRERFIRCIRQHAPAFIYFPPSDDPYYLFLEPILTASYHRVRRMDGNSTNLFIRNDRVKYISDENRKKMETLYYTLSQS